MVSPLSSPFNKHPLVLKLFKLLIISSILLSLLSPLRAQQFPTSYLQERVRKEVEQIQRDEQLHAPTDKLGALWSRLGSDYQDLADFSSAEKAYVKALQLLDKTSDANGNYATTLDNLGSLYMAMTRWSEAEQCRKASLVLRQKKGDKLGIARSYGYLAETYLGEHKLKEVEKYASMSYLALQSLGDPDKSEEVGVLLTRAYARCFSGKCALGLEDARLARTITNTGFQPNSLPTGQTLFALGFIEWKSGELERGLEAMRQGIDIFQDVMSEANPSLLGARMQYEQCLIAAHHDQEAREVAEQVAASMHQSKTPCPNCMVSVYGIANSWK